eukprot:UN27904
MTSKDQQVLDKFKQLRKEKYSDVKKVQSELKTIIKSQTDDNIIQFLEMLGDGWVDYLNQSKKHKLEITGLQTTNERQRRNNETLSKLCKTLRDRNAAHSKQNEKTQEWKTEMQKN